MSQEILCEVCDKQLATESPCSVCPECLKELRDALADDKIVRVLSEMD